MSREERPSKIEIMRHSTAHVMALAVKRLWPGARFGIGPVIQDGFYYDFDLPEALKPEDLKKIKKVMEKIIAQNLPFECQKLKINEAISLFQKNGQDYKVELIEDLKKKGTTKVDEAQDFKEEKPDLVTIYQTGEFTDLCRGPHLKRTSQIGAFQLTKLAGAYWRGDEKNKMLQRIYGVAFIKEAELENFLQLQKEAELRDHKKIGAELEIFTINENIGKGLPLLLPKGRIIRDEILKYEKELEKEAGFLHVWTPHIAKNDLYKLTGHWDHYQEMMYAPFGIDEETYVLKPMNCPHHYMIYKFKPRSWRDLPLRITEEGTVYRYEKSGELAGLARVRALTIDDSHIFMKYDQIKKEFSLNIEMVQKVFKAFAIKEYFVRFSLHDPRDKEKYIASPKVWQKAEGVLEEILKVKKIAYEKAVGEAAFYGPKIDFIVKDALGRPWQMSTLQLDFFMAEKLGLVYTDKDGQEKYPAILHRGLTGSLERTMAMLIEHYAGAFPLWLSPVQVYIIPVGSRHQKPSYKLAQELSREGIRTEVDDLNETVSYKIRKSERQKVPYMLVVGDIEAKGKTLKVRVRGQKKMIRLTKKKFVERILKEIKNKR